MNSVNPIFPLTPSQQAIFNEQMLAEGSAVYNIGGYTKIKGKISEERLHKAIQFVLSNHDSFGTRLLQPTIGMGQYFVPTQNEALVEIDFSKEKNASLVAIDWMKKEMDRPFVLFDEKLYSVAILKVSPTLYYWFLRIHHLIADGWSFPLIFTAVAEQYNFLSGNSPQPLPIPSFKDRIPDILAYNDSTQFEKDKIFWKGEMQDSFSPLFPTPVQFIAKSIRISLELKAETQQSIEEVSKKLKCTSFHLYLAAFYLWFRKVYERKDLVIGLPMVNRPKAEDKQTLGLFMKTYPLKLNFADGIVLEELIQGIKSQLRNTYRHARLGIGEIVKLRSNNSNTALFDLSISYINRSFETKMDAVPCEAFTIPSSDLRVGVALEINEYKGAPVRINLDFRPDQIQEDLVAQFGAFMENLFQEFLSQEQTQISQFSLLSSLEKEKMLHEIHSTASDLENLPTFLELFVHQYEKVPSAIALSQGTVQYSYAELYEKALELSYRLCTQCEVAPSDRIALLLPKGIPTVIGILGAMMARAAFVPIDPEYPLARVELMLSACNPKVTLLTKATGVKGIKNLGGSLLYLSEVTKTPTNWKPKFSKGNDLAYMIFTSGSTGRPKGVKILQQNLANFLAGMNDILQSKPKDAWLSLTSPSFDISILEVCWPLTTGMKVVFPKGKVQDILVGPRMPRKPDFSLFFFSSAQTHGGAKDYSLLFEATKYADENMFNSIWTPERHFHEFGGLFPNPSVTSAALAAMTTQIQIRAGSVVLPLHHPLRVAEEWAVVDNISNGRVGISITTGWNSNDFVFFPEKFEDRKEISEESLNQIQRLWSGEKVELEIPGNQTRAISLYPKPVQKELPIWVTASGNPATFIHAGEIGANLLTHLLGQSPEELKARIELYQQARKKAGFEEDGKITLMLHTYIGATEDDAIAQAKVPMKNYLKSSFGLISQLAESLGFAKEISSLSEEDLNTVLEYAFERYYQDSSLIGAQEKCTKTLISLMEVGVTEFACLIDFGIEHEEVLRGLKRLNELKNEFGNTLETLAEIIEKEGISHLQCTPSLAQLFPTDRKTQNALGGLKQILLGGEALPLGLAKSLQVRLESGQMYNMYGPTETTIWSSVWKIPTEIEQVLIGEGLKNNFLYVLDENMDLIPNGGIGELFIGGAGVSTGYYQNEELSARVFVENPFLEGQKMYKTGDLVRRNQKGELEFIGRRDQQVKYYGHRIELSGIEFKIRAYPDVRDVVLKVITNAESMDELVAWIIPEPSFEGSALQVWLESQLPEFMRPTSFTLIDKFPLTPNGKVDRKILKPALEQLDLIPTEGSSDNIELIRIEMANILGKPDFASNENFFHFGGDSIRAIQLSARLRQKGCSLPVAKIFEAPTPIRLAAHLEIRKNEIVHLPFLGAVPLAPMQHWFFDLNLEQSSHFNQSTLLKFNQPLTAIKVKEAIQQLIEHHDLLRAIVQVQENNRTLYVPEYKTELFLWKTARVNSDSERQEVLEEISADFDLKKGPMLGVGLIEQGSTQYVFIAIHHLLIDGISWRIIIEDLLMLLKTSAKSKLPSRTSSFADWSELLIKKTTNPEIQASRTYWKEQIGDSFVVGKIEKGPSKIIQTQIDFSAIETENQSHMEAILLSAYLKAIRMTFNEQKLLVHMESHGRQQFLEECEISRTVGWFTAGYPLLFSSEMGDTASKLLSNVIVKLDQVPQKGLSYGMLRWLEPDATLACAPKFAFNFLGNWMNESSSEVEYMLPILSLNYPKDQLAPFPFELNLIKDGQELHIYLRYNLSAFSSEKVQEFLDVYTRLIPEFVIAAENIQREQDESPNLLALLSSPILPLPNHEGRYKISLAQQFVLMMASQPGMETWFNEVRAVVIKGKLDGDKLQGAFQHVINEYEILRTNFEFSPELLQVVSKKVELPFHQENLSDLRGAIKEERIAAILQAEREWLFDLEKGLLINLKLLELAPNEHLLIMNNHHIISDGWSMGILIHKVIQAYNQLLKGKTVVLSSPSIQYADYSHWITQILTTQEVQNMGKYWFNKLGGKVAQLQLPLDFERPEILGIEGSSMKIVLDEDRKAALRMFQKENNLTLFQNFLVMVKALLFRVSGQTELVVGTTVALRNHPQLDDQIGILINYLVLRDYLDPSQSLDKFAASVQQTLLEGIENDLFPFPLLLDSIDYDKEPGRHPIFSVLVLERINEDKIIGMDGLEIEWYPNLPPKSRYDLGFLIQEEKGEIEIEIHYKKTLFEAATIEAILHWIEAFIQLLPEAKDRNINEFLPLWKQEFSRSLNN